MKLYKFAGVAGLFLFLAAGSSVFAGEPPSRAGVGINDFLKKLSTTMDLSKAHISVVDVSDPNNIVRGGWHDNEFVPAASVIKIAVLASAYHAVKNGRISLDSKVTISSKNNTGTLSFSGDPYPPMRPGQTWTIRDIINVMIRRSDNVATNTMIDILGRSNMCNFLHGIGCPNAYVRHKLSSGNTVVDPNDSGRNQLYPYDAATLLSFIARETLFSPAASKEMYDILSHQLDRELIAAALPKGVSYAGKTGVISNERNDAAIITGPNRHYVLVVYVSLPAGQARPIIRQIAAKVDAFMAAK